MNCKVYFDINDNINSAYFRVSFYLDEEKTQELVKFNIPKYKAVSILKTKFVYTFTQGINDIYIDKSRNMMIVMIGKSRYSFNDIDSFIETISYYCNYLYYEAADIPSIHDAISQFICDEGIIDYIIYRILMNKSMSIMSQQLNSSELSEIKYVAMLVESKIIDKNSTPVSTIFKIDNSSILSWSDFTDILFKNDLFTINACIKNLNKIEKMMDPIKFKTFKAGLSKFIVLGV